MRQKLFIASLLLTCAVAIHAADHAEAPLATADPASDIADIFLFRADNKLVAAVTWAGISAPAPRVDGPIGTYNPNVLFEFNFDLDADNKPEFVVYGRFGQNSDGDWGVEMENIPGAGSKFVFGPVESVITSRSGLRVYAALRDDPFYFDSQGFSETVASFGDTSDPNNQPSGQNLIRNDRDSFAFRNITALVFEMEIDDAYQGATEIHYWVTTARLFE